MKCVCALRSVRVTSLSLSLVLLAPYFAVSAGAASADTPSSTGPNAGKRLCVLDFTDLSRSGGAGLGRIAASHFASQLTEAQRWQVLPDTQLRDRATKLALPMPMDRAARLRLAADSGSEQVVYGTVTAARVQEKPTRQAYVRMMVLVEDAKTGELLQGAVSEGASGPNHPPTAAREQLLADAMTNAAASFARYLAEPKSVPATTTTSPNDSRRDRSVQEDAPAPQRDTSGTSSQIVTEKEARQLLAQVTAPDPVVIETPNTGLEESGGVRRSFFNTRTVRLLVGGILLAGLLYLGGTGGIGSTRPF